MKKFLCLLTLLFFLFNCHNLFSQLKWKNFCNLNVPRCSFGAVDLGNHKIMIIGGFTTNYNITNTCEIIDVANKTSTFASPMNISRVEFACIVTKDTNIIVLGGASNWSSTACTPTVERYNKQSGTWELIGNLQVPRMQIAALPINDDEIIVAGSRTSGFAISLKDVEIFNHKTGKSRLVKEFPYYFADGNAAISSKGDFIFFSWREGGTNSTHYKQVYRYNVNLNNWELVSNLPEARQFANVIKLKDGKVLLSGGCESEAPLRYSDDIYLESNNSFTSIANMPVGLQMHQMNYLNDSTIIITGGYNSSYSAVKECNLFNLNTYNISSGPSLNNARGRHKLITIENNNDYKVLAIGGAYINSGSLAPISSIEILEFEAPKPPQISFKSDCNVITGEVTPSENSYSRIKQVTVDSSTLENVKVYIEDFQPYKDKVHFSGELDDYTKSGYFKISVLDSLNMSNGNGFLFQGLTVSVPKFENKNDVYHYSQSVKEGVEYIFKIPIYNYGIAPISMKETEHTNNNEFKIISSISLFSLKHLEYDTIIVKFKSSQKGDFCDTIKLNDYCYERVIAVLHPQFNECDTRGFTYQNFNNTNGLNFVDKTQKLDTAVRLTTTNINLRGAMWYNTLIPVKLGFSTQFNFRFSEGIGNDDGSLPGADGIAFVIQNDKPTAIGENGGGIGYHDIKNAIAIEFDTYSNDSKKMENFFDPNGSHIAVQSSGSDAITAKHIDGANYAMANKYLGTDINVTYYAKIDYNIIPNTLRVFCDTTGDLNVPVIEIDSFDISKIINLNQEEFAWVGFTSATGSASENHDILYWSFCPSPTGAISPVYENQIFDENISVYPNPFSNIVNFDINLTVPCNVTLKIYDLYSNEIVTLINNEISAGKSIVKWDATKYSNQIFFYNLIIGEKVYSGKFMKVE